MQNGRYAAERRCLVKVPWVRGTKQKAEPWVHDDVRKVCRGTRSMAVWTEAHRPIGCCFYPHTAWNPSDRLTLSTCVSLSGIVWKWRCWIRCWRHTMRNAQSNAVTICRTKYDSVWNCCATIAIDLSFWWTFSRNASRRSNGKWDFCGTQKPISGHRFNTIRKRSPSQWWCWPFIGNRDEPRTKIYLNKRPDVHRSIRHRTFRHIVQRWYFCVRANWCTRMYLQNKENGIFSLSTFSLKLNSKILCSLIIGTVAVCRMAVPVCPMLMSTLPQPAISPRRPVSLIGLAGKQMGWMWFLMCRENMNKLVLYIYDRRAF